MRGEAPVAELGAESRTNLNGALDLVVRNRGTDTFHGPIALHARWNAELTRLLAADAIHGFQLHREHPGAIRMESSSCRLPPGEAVVVGWARLESFAPVNL